MRKFSQGFVDKVRGILFFSFRSLLLLIPFSLLAAPAKKIISEPWLTGPLIAASGITEDPGEFDVEPYLFSTKTYNTPRQFTLSPALDYTHGLAKRLDIEAVLPYAFNEQSGHWINNFEDLNIALGFQALRTPVDSLVPNIRLVLQETFPTGQYQHLSSLFPNINATGDGSYQTGLGMNLEQLFYMPNGKPIDVILNLTYTIPSSANVHGFNTYGGGFNTAGNVDVGKEFFADFAFQYVFAQHWVAAMDVTYQHNGSASFTGNSGVNPDGTPATVGLLANEEITLAPAIEYNFNEHWGVIGGAWFTVYVHNVSNFASGVIALNYSS